MKLSDIVAFRNELDSFSVADVQNKTNGELSKIVYLIQTWGALLNQLPEELESDRKTISSAVDTFNQTLDKVKSQINKLIEEEEKQWFLKSYKLFEEAEYCETTEHILNNRRIAVNDSTELIIDTLKARISKLEAWRFPGMIIRPGLEDFTETMVGYDPLYIIDQKYDLLTPFIERFPQTYQNRLRPVVTNEWSDQPLLDKIPDNQFGMCLAYNVFNYRPFEVLRRYLEEIYQKLRPGGVMILTFNDCDNAHAVRLVERFYACYTPGWLVRELIASIGFEITFTWGGNNPCVWLEIRKPGKLTGNRGGQVIATTHHLIDYQKDIDYLKRKVYTKEEVDDLKTQAHDLEILESDIVDKQPYELQVIINNVLDGQRLETERQYIEKLKIQATSYGINISDSNWKEQIDRILYDKWQEEIRVAEETEKKRIEDLHQRARDHGVVDPGSQSEIELQRLIAEEIDRRKKTELARLRQRALQIEAGDPNLVRYGYSAEKLKALIDEREKFLIEQKATNNLKGNTE